MRPIPATDDQPRLRCKELKSSRLPHTKIWFNSYVANRSGPGARLRQDHLQSPLHILILSLLSVLFRGVTAPPWRMKNHYLKRRQTTAAAASFANPQDYDHDIENAPLVCQKSLDYELEADHCSVPPSRRSSEAFLSELSPMSRRIVRFVTPSSASMDRCTSECMTVALARILPSLAVIFGFPFVLWDGYPEEWSALNLYPLFRHVEMVWSSALHTSLYMVAAATFVAVACIPNGGLRPRKMLPPRGNGSTTDRLNVALSDVAVNITQSNWKSSLALAVVLTTFGLFHMTLQMGYPHILWNPFMWGWYTVYQPGSIPRALRGACLDMQKHSTAKQPLCLSEDKWQELSSGQLSSHNPDDVYAVQRGLDYLRNQSGGLVVNALARNVADAIPSLKQNMEGLAPFFQDSRHKLSLVVFENDSNDGTRALFKSWAKEESTKESPRYVVDIMSCGDANPDCNLGIQDRYDKDLFKNPNASGVGKLGEFRNVLLEYILNKEEYKSYSHMVVLDVDLGVSISPLGLIHTLGLENGLGQDYAVASSSSQVWCVIYSHQSRSG